MPVINQLIMHQAAMKKDFVQSGHPYYSSSHHHPVRSHRGQYLNYRASSIYIIFRRATGTLESERSEPRGRYHTSRLHMNAFL